jgi:hypothetical protein
MATLTIRGKSVEVTPEQAQEYEAVLAWLDNELVSIPQGGKPKGLDGPESLVYRELGKELNAKISKILNGQDCK